MAPLGQYHKRSTMDQHPQHKSMQELAASVKGHVDELSNGNLSLEEIEAVVAEMRDLYERLVVVRHGAYLEKGGLSNEEGSQLSQEGKATNEEQESGEEQSNVEAYTEEGVNEPAAPSLFKLDTQQAIEPSVPDNQTSLIDQIEELDGNSGEESLAEKMEQTPIADLRKAIGLNQKFWFIKELFNDDADAYDAAIEAFETADSLDAAQVWFDASVRPDLGEDHDEKAVLKFLELLERRFLTNA